jgi:choline dehydrogenase
MANLRLANLILLSRRRVNNRLQVYGIDRLRIADAAIMPDITSGNTMAPCVVIGERAAEMIKADYGI